MRIVRNLITHSNPKSPVSEAYRTMRTNIQFSSLDKDIVTITITSSEPGEGKSTVLTNLAVTMAESGKKVLIVDCDLRKPMVHKLFKLNNSLGFTSALIENVEIDSVIKNDLDIEGLSVITSGPLPPNPSELLNSKKARMLFEALKKKFDIILIDAPPIGAVTDAAILSTYVDGIILVVAHGQASIEMIKRSKSLLDKVNAPLLGAVFNKIPISDKKYHGDFYYRYYSYE